jgi:hypothetical protein
MFKRSIVCSFRILRETTAGKLSHVQVIGKAFAANPFSGAGFIGTVASLHVFFLITVHVQTSF